MQEHAKKTLGAVAQAAKTAGVACETVHVEHEHPYQAIIDTAKSKGCDLIVMASHGRRGVSAIVLGSETVKVLTHSKNTRCSSIAEPHGEAPGESPQSSIALERRGADYRIRADVAAVCG